MLNTRWLWLVLLLGPLALAGCTTNSDKTPAGKQTSAEKQYSIKGKVVAVDAAKPSVKLDHEDIPGLMKGMQMDFTVENAKVLEGLKAGDQVQGHLKVESGKHIITHLEKR
jgi:Cu/Ag efflux protein CusF